MVESRGEFLVLLSHAPKPTTTAFFVVPAVMSLSYMVDNQVVGRKGKGKQPKQMLILPKRYERQAGS